MERHSSKKCKQETIRVGICDVEGLNCTGHKQYGQVTLMWVDQCLQATDEGCRRRPKLEDWCLKARTIGPAHVQRWLTNVCRSHTLGPFHIPYRLNVVWMLCPKSAKHCDWAKAMWKVLIQSRLTVMWRTKVMCDGHDQGQMTNVQDKGDGVK